MAINLLIGFLRGVAQLVEYWFWVPVVAGSSPATPKNKRRQILKVITTSIQVIESMFKGEIYPPKCKWALISILDSGSKSVIKSNNKSYDNLVNTIELTFDDISSDIVIDYYPNLVLFNKTHAEQIIKFVEKVFNVVELIIIHCSAGISRSGAIGLWIVDKYNLDYKEFIKANKQILPNRHVYGLLSSVSSQRVINELYEDIYKSELKLDTIF